MRKNIIILAVMAFFAACVFAQIPDKPKGKRTTKNGVVAVSHTRHAKNTSSRSRSMRPGRPAGYTLTNTMISGYRTKPHRRAKGKRRH